MHYMTSSPTTISHKVIDNYEYNGSDLKDTKFGFKKFNFMYYWIKPNLTYVESRKPVNVTQEYFLAATKDVLVVKMRKTNITYRTKITASRLVIVYPLG